VPTYRICIPAERPDIIKKFNDLEAEGQLAPYIVDLIREDIAFRKKQAAGNNR